MYRKFRIVEDQDMYDDNDCNCLVVHDDVEFIATENCVGTLVRDEDGYPLMFVGNLFNEVGVFYAG